MHIIWWPDGYEGLTAFLISPPIGIGSGVITELCEPEERGKKLGWWMLLTTIGTPAGPFLMGFVTQHIGVSLSKYGNRGCNNPYTKYHIGTMDFLDIFHRQFRPIHILSCIGGRNSIPRKII